jgi:small subunit ribosomal protein S17
MALSLSGSMASLRVSSFAGQAVAPARAAPAACRPAGALRVVAEQNLIGQVVSTACAKSVVIRVQRQVAHPKYMKRVVLSKKYMAHDEEEVAKVGDVVRITSCRPMSARKRFAVAEVVKSAFVLDAPLPSETAGAR